VVFVANFVGFKISDKPKINILKSSLGVENIFSTKSPPFSNIK
jgi:hypothetical protein